MALARLALAESDRGDGDANAAVAEASRAEETLRGLGAADDAAVAQVLLAKAMLALGRSGEAQVLATRVSATASKSGNRRVRLSVSGLSAQLRAATGRAAAAAAVKELDRVAAEAARSSFVLLSYDLRLDAARIEARAGLTSSAAARAVALEREASGKGIGLVAEGARRLRRNSVTPRARS